MVCGGQPENLLRSRSKESTSGREAVFYFGCCIGFLRTIEEINLAGTWVRGSICVTWDGNLSTSPPLDDFQIFSLSPIFISLSNFRLTPNIVYNTSPNYCPLFPLPLNFVVYITLPLIIVRFFHFPHFLYFYRICHVSTP